MPSISEPCGLSQMIAMRYGTVPIVRLTGGLKDSVPSYNPTTGEGLGFTFGNITAGDMLSAVDRALAQMCIRDSRRHFLAGSLPLGRTAH